MQTATRTTTATINELGACLNECGHMVEQGDTITKTTAGNTHLDCWGL